MGQKTTPPPPLLPETADSHWKILITEIMAPFFAGSWVFARGRELEVNTARDQMCCKRLLKTNRELLGSCLIFRN